MNQNKGCSFENLCEIYLLYFDEVLGHVFLLTCPENIPSQDSSKINIIMHHPIWFLDLKDNNIINRIDLEYNGVMYFARKFLVVSGRTKKRLGSLEDQFETVILIITLSADLDIFGGELLNLLTNSLISEFSENIFEIIESEVAKLEIIKSNANLQRIEKGEQLKTKIKSLITSVCQNYFSSVIRQKDATTIKLQKAISYLIFKGVDINHIVGQANHTNFSNIRLFDYEKYSQTELNIKEKFKLISVNAINENQEFEILIKSTHKKALSNLRAKITYIQDFFEREILNEKIEKCLPDEQLLLVAPIPAKVNEFVLSIVNDSTNKKIYSRKIKLNLES